LFGSQRVIPTALEVAGFQFHDPEVGPALQRNFG
jgi:NAD dependent epimerase/dehydratase family enzyme